MNQSGNNRKESERTWIIPFHGEVNALAGKVFTLKIV
jgi:hypothetical protein